MRCQLYSLCPSAGGIEIKRMSGLAVELAHSMEEDFSRSWRNNFTPRKADAQDLDFFYKPGLRKRKKKVVGNPPFPSNNGGLGKQFKLLRVSVSPWRFESPNAVLTVLLFVLLREELKSKGCQNLLIQW
ncbi:hypothetical protein CEXT_752971 [Caerostris extrusa]|uniref:Uncharacterized protein n=1 Tax=Caerostris extrusa TaxID=172846 RepID=A0AAV4VDG0_CAEEX|nr:hypothetical protein CEXT_752971 [Caerostris extrusa]